VTGTGRRGPAVLAFAAGIAAVIVILGVAVATFFNPLWIGFEQERTGVPAITGWTSEQVRSATGSILADLFLGPPSFAAAVNGQPILDAAERSHMVDVRNVVLPSMVILGVAVALLAALFATRRRRAWFWHAISVGSGALTVVGVVVGVAVLFFFDAAFLLFHLVFFPQGNFSFDPRTQRLTQLFPDQFWTETAIAIAVVGLLIAAGVTVAARRQAGRLQARGSTNQAQRRARSTSSDPR
jgi:integral membrane protein (TIGR01906 family)